MAAAPRLIKVVAAAPVKAVFGGVTPVGEERVVLLPDPAVRVKLAHVKRVVLRLWILIERLPRKAPMPLWVEA